MKNLTLVSLAVVLLSVIATAQDTKAAPSTDSTRAVTLSGRVSDDGMTLVSDGDREWLVSNADALDGHEGHQVTVKCRPYPGEHRIQVLSVKMARGAAKYTANLQDSAFRR